MKTQLMKKTLATLALGSLGLMATGAQAEGNRGNHDYGHNSYTSSNGPFSHHQQGGHAYQSQQFIQQINARQDRQMDRIQAGMRSGNLTRFEFRDLMHEQREIRAMEQHFRSDGLIDAREFQRLDRALDVASRNTKEEKHDRQARNAYSHHPGFN